MRLLHDKLILVDSVRDSLRDSIVNLNIRPGEKLNELKLSKSLDVSRSVLREAFRLLQAEGFIYRLRGRGVYVRQVTANDVLELFTIRAALESLAAGLAASRLSERELDNLEKITRKMEQAIQNNDIADYARLNMEFHNQIVTGAGNKRLEDMIKNAAQQSLWFFSAALYHKKTLKYSMRSHKEISLALQRRDGEQAAQLIKDHIKDGGIRIVEYFQ